MTLLKVCRMYAGLPRQGQPFIIAAQKYPKLNMHLPVPPGSLLSIPIYTGNLCLAAGSLRPTP